MKKLIFATFFLSLFSMPAFSQLQVGGGPAYFLNEKFLEEQNSSLDYTLSLGYAIRKFDVGFEFIKNGYKDWGNGKEFYEFYQYQAFGRFYPFKRRTWFLKGGVNYSTEEILQLLLRLTLIKSKIWPMLAWRVALGSIA